MKYFAYGANTDPANMVKRCPGARVLGIAMLPDHRLVFRRQRAWRGGVAHVEHTPGARTWGVLWEIDDACERALDRYEEVDRGLYAKGRVSVETADGVRIEAMVYLAVPEREKAPSRRTLRMLERGASAHDLPVEQREAFRAARKGSAERRRNRP